MEAQQLDLLTGEHLRERAFDSMEVSAAEFLATIRAEARRIAREQGRVSSDELRHAAKRIGIYPPHENCWGGIFRGAEWYCIGRTRSRLPSNHAREIKVWSLTPPENLNYRAPQRQAVADAFVENVRGE